MKRAWEKAAVGSALMALFFIPVGTKKFIVTLLPEWFEYTRTFSSLFVYLTDFALIATAGSALAYWGAPLFARSRRILLLGFFLACAAASLLATDHLAFSSIALVRFAFAALFALVLGTLLREKRVSFRAAAAAIGAASALQGLIAVFQFMRQGSLGIPFLGETIIGPLTAGVARVSLEGVGYLRAYGTLPHANILAAFLVLGIFSLGYLLIVSGKGRIWERMLLTAGLFLSLAGLLLTFSRSGWIAVVCGIAFILLRRKGRGSEKMPRAQFLVPLACSLAALFLIFGWAIIPRAGFSSREPSVDHRVFYNEIGATLLLRHPFGVGLAGEALAAEREGLFLEKGLAARWLWQPVHNLYLLAASEIGIQGFVALLLLLSFVWKSADRMHEAYPWFAGALFAFLVFGLFDHFFWDLEAGRLMFWSVLGIMMGLEKTPSYGRPMRVHHSTEYQASSGLPSHSPS